MQIDLDQLRALMRAIEDHDIAEVEIESGDERILLRRNSLTAPFSTSAATQSQLPVAAEPMGSPAGADLIDVTSPFVGTFYRAPSPGSPPYVQLGAQVSSGQILCIVEAMKLMNEIESEVSGVVEEILVENGKPVEFGDVLFRMKPQG